MHPHKVPERLGWAAIEQRVANTHGFEIHAMGLQFACEMRWLGWLIELPIILMCVRSSGRSSNFGADHDFVEWG